MSEARLLPAAAKSLLAVLVLVPLSAAQFHLPNFKSVDLTSHAKTIQNGKIGDLGKVAEAVKEVASQSNVQKAAEAIQQTDEVQQAKGLLDGVAQDESVSEALKSAPTDKIEDVVGIAAGTLQKGVEAINSTNTKDVEAALHQVAGQPAATSIFNMTGPQLMGAIQNAVPQAQKVLQEAFEGDSSASDAGMGGEASVQRVIERVKGEVANGGGPVSMLTSVLVLATCGVCACFNLKRQNSARSPALDYGIQLEPSNEEPFFRSF